MKRKLKSLALSKSVVSDLNHKNSNEIIGGRLPLTNADTYCNSFAIICKPSINFSCGGGN